MMTGRVGEYKREDKDDAPRPGASGFDSQKRVQAEKAILFLSITVASGLLMVSVHSSLVDTKSWGFDIPSVYSAVRDDVFLAVRFLLSWQKLKVYSEERSRTLNRETGNEWFHWLAERMIEREKLSPPVPAYIAHRDWKKL